MYTITGPKFSFGRGSRRKMKTSTYGFARRYRFRCSNPPLEAGSSRSTTTTAGTDSVTTSLDFTSYWFCLELFRGSIKVDDKEPKTITGHYHQVSTTIITAAAEDFSEPPNNNQFLRLEIYFSSQGSKKGLASRSTEFEEWSRRSRVCCSWTFGLKSLPLLKSVPTAARLTANIIQIPLALATATITTAATTLLNLSLPFPPCLRT